MLGERCSTKSLPYFCLIKKPKQNKRLVEYWKHANGRTRL